MKLFSQLPEFFSFGVLQQQLCGVQVLKGAGLSSLGVKNETDCSASEKADNPNNHKHDVTSKLRYRRSKLCSDLLRMLAAPPVTPASDIKSRVVRWCLNMREPSGAVNHTSSAWLPLVEMKRAPTQCCRHRLPSGWTTRPTINMCCKENYLQPSLNTFSHEKCSVHVVRVLHCFSPLPSAPCLILQHPLNTVDTTRHLSTSILHFRLQAKEKFECVKPGPRGQCSPRCCEFSTLLFILRWQDGHKGLETASW